MQRILLHGAQSDHIKYDLALFNPLSNHGSRNLDYPRLTF